jgi:hypothetical protein
VNLVVNGNFSDPIRNPNGYNTIYNDVSIPPLTTGLPNWTMTGRTVYLARGVTPFANFTPTSTTREQYVVVTIEESPPTQVTISQSINISSTGSYAVTLHMCLRLAFQFPTIVCTFNGASLTATNIQLNDFEFKSTSFTVYVGSTGAYPLKFTFTGTGGQQISIAAVSVNKVTFT